MSDDPTASPTFGDDGLQPFLRFLSQAPQEEALAALMNTLQARAQRGVPRWPLVRRFREPEDISQAALLELLKQTGDFEGASWEAYESFASSVLDSVLRGTNRMLRTQKRGGGKGSEFPPGLSPEGLPDEGSGAGTPSRLAMHEEDRRRLYQLIHTVLEPTEHEIVRLRLLGYGHATIAERMGMEPPATRQRYHRALGRLRAAWGASSA